MRAVWVLIALGAAWGQDTGSIEGVVTNAVTHTPVANVRVVVDQASGPDSNQPQIAVTDASGVYRLDQLASRDYVVTFSANTYVSTISPVVHVSSGAVRVNADLSPSATLHGRVLDDEGQPAAEHLR